MCRCIGVYDVDVHVYVHVDADFYIANEFSNNNMFLELSNRARCTA